MKSDTIKGIMLEFLGFPAAYHDEAGDAMLKAALYADEERTNRHLLVYILFQRACKGDVAAVREIRRIVGEEEEKSSIGALEELIRNTLGGRYGED